MQQISADPHNTVIIMSGRDKSHLDLHWSSYNIVLVAENGALYREPGIAWTSLFDIDDSWMERVGNAMRSLLFQYKGSYLESRRHSIIWHYMTPGNADVENDLDKIVSAIRALPQYGQFEVYEYHQKVELGPPGVDVGSFLTRWIGGKRFDLVMAIGSEPMHRSLSNILSQEAVTVSVSPVMTTSARYWLKSQQQVVTFLKGLQVGS